MYYCEYMCSIRYNERSKALRRRFLGHEKSSSVGSPT